MDTTGEEDETYTFRLFAPSKSSKSSHTKSQEPSTSQLEQDTKTRNSDTPIHSQIKLTPPLSPSIQPFSTNSIGKLPSKQLKPLSVRPQSYYIRDPLTPEAKEDFAAAALSYQQLKHLSSLPWNGMKYEWRIVHLSPSQDHTSHKFNVKIQPGKASRISVLAPEPAHGSEGDKLEQQKIKKNNKSKPGKKSRIKQRKIRDEARVKEEENNREERQKEEYLREKKKKLNRQKQIKKREKKRQGKAVDGTAGTVGPDDGGVANVPER